MDVIKDLAHSVAVMAEGRVVEQGSVLETFLHPRAEITRDFVSTVVPQGLPRRVVDHLGSDGLWRLLLDRKSVVEGKRVSVRVDLGVRRILKTKSQINK